MKEEIKFSFSSCWTVAKKYCFFSFKKINQLEIKNNIIEICSPSAIYFWENFENKILDYRKYKKICLFLEKYLLYNYAVPFLTGKVVFFSNSFMIKRGVFIPQKDTEILLEKVLSFAESSFTRKNLRVLEIGTGCGNIAISLAKERPNWEITATDINCLALKVAKRNSFRHRTSIKFVHSDLFEKIQKENKFELIIFNPPYLNKNEFYSLDPMTKNQPFSALVAPEEDFFFYWKTFKEAAGFVTHETLFFFEISPHFEKRVVDWFVSFGKQVIIFKDYNGLSRLMIIK